MSDRKITEAIQRLAGTQLTDEVYILICTVDSVDVDGRTCDCTAVGGTAITDIPGVQLMAEVDDGALYIPAIGSTVIVVYSKRNVPYIALYSELSALYYVVGDTTLDITNGLIKFNDGSFEGLVKVVELTQKLNALENKVNDLIATFNTHVHGGVSTGGGSTATTATPVTGTLTPTTQSEIENEKIIHGI